MASANSLLIQSFLRAIGNDIKLYNQLLSLLKQQKMLYLKFEDTGLLENIHRQSPLLERLMHSATERARCLQSLGLPKDEQGIKKLMNVLPEHIASQAREQWQTLHDLITQCQQYNNENGQTSATFHELISQLTHPETHTYQEHTELIL